MDAKGQSDGMNIANWQPIETAPEGVLVLTVIHDRLGVRNQQPLMRRGRLWFVASGEMYVYYTPTHWKPLQRVRDVLDSPVLKETA